MRNLGGLSLETRQKCLRCSYKICGREALLPKSLPIPPHRVRSDTLLHCGGFTDVWKGKYNGQIVAVKILRVHSTSDLEKAKKVNSSQLVVLASRLITSYAAILQGGGNVEDASSSERAAIIGRRRKSAHDGIRVDEEWEHQ